jgi:succinate-acetate transporter protein
MTSPLRETTPTITAAATRPLGPDQKIRSRISLKDSSFCSFNSDESCKKYKMVAVRYFLDRPGYGLHNSAARLWFDPPPICKPKHLRDYLTVHRIALPGLLVEVYLDKIESFMSLDACEHCKLEWDFSDTTPEKPGVLNIRLTDLEEAREEETISELDKLSSTTGVVASRTVVEKSPRIAFANVTQVGLFSFSMMVGMETLNLTSELVPGSISPAYIETWGPFMFFVGGLMQLCVAIFQVLRNNVYGATAFFGFGCFWFSNGLIAILQTYVGVADESARTYPDDTWGHFIRAMYMFMFCCVLLVQTFAMNKLSSTLILLLSMKALAGAFTPWSDAAQWIQFVFGWTTSFFAFYVFLVEMTNSIYQRDVFRVFRWSEDSSPEEVFGAAGRSGTLHSKAARLRQAHYTFHKVRKADQSQTCLSDETSLRLTQEKSL